MSRSRVGLGALLLTASACSEPFPQRVQLRPQVIESFAPSARAAAAPRTDARFRAAAALGACYVRGVWPRPGSGATRLGGWIAAGLAAVACGPSAEPELVSGAGGAAGFTGAVAETGGSAPGAGVFEIAAEGWQPASAAEDPFAELAQGRVRCSPFAFRIEAGWLEVTTTDCNYATLVHRFSRNVLAGEVIRGEIAWATLAAVEPAIGTLAFATARDGVLWRHEVPIPSGADLVSVELVLATPAPAGAALYFHVHNHGYNAWQLSPLTVTEPHG